MDFILIIIIIILGIIIKKFFNQSINPYRFSKIHQWAQQGKYFNFDGYPIFYYDSSVRDVSAMSKPTLLLLHGYPTSSIDWLLMRDELEQRFHIIAPDYIGYGLSAKPVSFPYSISSQVNMIEQLLSSLKLNQFHVMAHDVGDTIAQEFLARQVDDRQYIIQSTVLLNGGLFPETHRAFFTMKMLKTPILGVIIQYIIPRSLFASAINRVFGPSTQRSKQELDEIVNLLFYNAPYNLLQQLQCYINERAIFRNRWVNALNKVQTLDKNPIPIRFINGPFDPISGKHMVDRYREIIKNPDTCVLAAHIGHYPNLEDPENTLKHFFDFHNSIST
jgi:pimeloyl-ACP methyl ester carboxylesterase